LAHVDAIPVPREILDPKLGEETEMTSADASKADRDPCLAYVTVESFVTAARRHAAGTLDSHAGSGALRRQHRHGTETHHKE
jgi:hypothetical protein